MCEGTYIRAIGDVCEAIGWDVCGMAMCVGGRVSCVMCTYIGCV